MKISNIKQAAERLHQCWVSGEVVHYAKNDFWPETIEQGYQVQAALADLRNEPVIGWKIAAATTAGRIHMNVYQPLIGRLFPSMCYSDGDVLQLYGKQMAVVEEQFVFTLGKCLPLKQSSFTEAQVVAAIESLRPGLEFPDTRFADFTQPGTPGLIADNACAAHIVIGQPSTQRFDPMMLADHAVSLSINGKIATGDRATDTVDGPISAMVLVANKLNQLGLELEAGQFISVGVGGKPTPISHGDTVRADFGKHGAVGVVLN